MNTKYRRGDAPPELIFFFPFLLGSLSVTLTSLINSSKTESCTFTLAVSIACAHCNWSYILHPAGWKTPGCWSSLHLSWSTSSKNKNPKRVPVIWAHFTGEIIRSKPADLSLLQALSSPSALDRRGHDGWTETPRQRGQWRRGRSDTSRESRGTILRGSEEGDRACKRLWHYCRLVLKYFFL